MSALNNKMSRTITVAGLILAMSFAPATAANLVLNGSFETTTGGVPATAVGQPPENWSEITNSFGVWNGIAPQDGSWFLHAGSGFNNGGRYQDVNLVGGQEYILTFYAAGFPGEATLQLGLVQVGTPGSNDNDLGLNNNAEYVNASLNDIPLTWQQYSYNFTPSASGPVRVSFQNVSSGGGAGSRSAINIDNVNLDVIPEPSTMWLVALGVAGYGWRRKRS